MMKYSASLSNLKGLRDLERETILTEYHDVYSLIEKFKVIREANCLREGMFFFINWSDLPYQKTFLAEQASQAGPSVLQKDKKSCRKRKGKARMVQGDFEGVATQDLDSMLNFL
jgi:hypothetical protein